MGGGVTSVEVPGRANEFWHGAFMYAGDTEFVDGVGQFLQEGLDADEPMLVVVAAAKIGWLRDHLGAASAAIRFEDMDEVGRNPGRIIGYWRDFVDEQQGAARRGAWASPCSPPGRPRSWPSATTTRRC